MKSPDARRSAAQVPSSLLVVLIRTSTPDGLTVGDVCDRALLDVKHREARPKAKNTRSQTAAAPTHSQTVHILSIQFRSAVEEGIRQGNQIGRFVFTHALRSLHQDADEDD
jgi:hypothetical protein